MYWPRCWRTSSRPERPVFPSHGGGPSAAALGRRAAGTRAQASETDAFRVEEIVAEPTTRVPSYSTIA